MAGNVDRRGENLDGRTGEHDVAALGVLDVEIAAAKMDRRFSLGAAGDDAGDEHRARTRAARERFARAALPHAHRQLRGRIDAYELGVDALREEAVVLELRADLLEVEAFEVARVEDHAV